MSGSATLTMLKSSTTTAWAPRTTARPRPASAEPGPDPVASLSLTDSSALLLGRANEELVDGDVPRPGHDVLDRLCDVVRLQRLDPLEATHRRFADLWA